MTVHKHLISPQSQQQVSLKQTQSVKQANSTKLQKCIQPN